MEVYFVDSNTISKPRWQNRPEKSFSVYVSINSNSARTEWVISLAMKQCTWVTNNRQFEDKRFESHEAKSIFVCMYINRYMWDKAVKGDIVHNKLQRSTYKYIHLNINTSELMLSSWKGAKKWSPAKSPYTTEFTVFLNFICTFENTNKNIS